MAGFIGAYYKYVPVAIFAGVIIDLILGDPMWLIHPVQIIGKLISVLEKRLLGESVTKSKTEHVGDADSDRKEDMNDVSIFWRGMFLWIVVASVAGVVTFAIIFLCYKLNCYLMLAFMAIMSWQCIAARSLSKAAMKVCRALKKNDIELARKEVSMIVGRDTENLDEKGIARAAVETVAENTNDGVICPLFYLMLGGPILAFIYKAVSTMDSMIGYKNDKYMFFGRFAAKADDVFAFVPARLSAVFMIIAAALLGDYSKNYDAGGAVKIFIRDRYNHASPNSAQCESVCAGALGIRLAGPTSYFGKLHDKPYIGDAKREIENADIRRSVILMYATAAVLLILYCLIYAAVSFI
ncbi:cobalamin biosynthesis protein CobD [Butyrivibrio sp. X503]|uniref:adenosylcobinamide-phosphate synthase CbiB n=1 Tax=Butyrivibrio sp. X503 TaxID=2364878 RepID=UPI000EAA8457|nr:adenosylcobinamide-phosphate synthase CbiB [Butyrivibrio sp. X503]RKM58329.1 cobalamin biosynthesis protein CobD [Butyrivibrio sp. X503]